MRIEQTSKENNRKKGKKKYRIQYIAMLIVLLSLSLLLYMPQGWTASVAETEKSTGEESIKLTKPKNDQERLKKLEKDVENMSNDIHKGIREGYYRNNEAINNLTNFIGIIATIFGIIIALAGLFVGYESIRSRQRREEAIKTLEEAKSYVENKIKDFNKAIRERLKEVDKLVQISLDQLAQDTKQAAKRVEEESARKVKEIEEKSIATEEKEKIDLLEKRIKFFEEIGMPDDPKLLFAKAMMCKEKKMLSESVGLLRRAIELDKDYKEAYWQIGWLQDELDRPEESIEAYKQIIRINPKDSDAYYNIAIILETLNKNQEALEYINEAIKIEPKSAYYRTKARAFEKLEKYAEALENTELAIQLDPNAHSAYCLKGRVLAKRGDGEGSLEAYKKANEILTQEVGKTDASEGIGFEYFELHLILDKYQEAAEQIPQLRGKISGRRYLYIFDFLIACLLFLQTNIEDGFKQIFIILDKFEKDPLETRILWIFEDINHILESKLENNIYQACIAIEKLLLKEISVRDCKEEIQKSFNKELEKEG